MDGLKVMPRNDDKRTEKNEEARKGVIHAIFTWPIAIISALFISALISYLIEVLGMLFDWWDLPGVLHSQKMVEQELVHLNDRLDKSVIEWASGVTVKEIFDNTIGYVEDGLSWLGLMSFANSNATGGFGAYLGAMANMILLTAMRFMVFVFALPLFGIWGYVGFIIGVFERDKRRAGIGRESGAIFQASRKLVPLSLAIPFFAYLAWPNSIDPLFIIFPFAVFLGIAIAYTAASYRKYM